MNDENFENLKKAYFTSSPKNVYAKGNLSYYYWYNYLMRVLISTFKFHDFPQEWDIDVFRETLFNAGYVGVTKHFKTGIVALPCSYTGLNIYLKPTMLQFTNPVLGTFSRRIRENAEVIYFDWYNSHFDTMHSVVSRYAVMLANTDASLNVTLMNSRVAMVFTGSNKAEVNSAKKMYDDVTDGKPAVFQLSNKTNESLGEVFFNNVKNNYIGNDLLVTQQSIINNFCTHIGINNANTQKKERLIKDEAESNNQLTRTLSDMWLENINACFDRVRVLFPEIKTTVSLRKEVNVDEL